MNETVLAALIAAAGAVFGSYLANSKLLAVVQEQISGIKAQIAELSDRVNEHNKFDKRIALLESAVKDLKEKN